MNEEELVRRIQRELADSYDEELELAADQGKRRQRPPRQTSQHYHLATGKRGGQESTADDAGNPGRGAGHEIRWPQVVRHDARTRRGPIGDAD